MAPCWLCVSIALHANMQLQIARRRNTDAFSQVRGLTLVTYRGRLRSNKLALTSMAATSMQCAAGSASARLITTRGTTTGTGAVEKYRGTNFASHCHRTVSQRKVVHAQPVAWRRVW
eukprot:363203-Chlamydomonas_euryale.AAC.25